MPDAFSRRHVMAGMGACAALIPGTAFAADPEIPAATIAARKNAPIIPKKVNRLYNLKAAIDQPNDMQFAANGDLWILDQKDPNKVFTINPATGEVLRTFTPISDEALRVRIGQAASNIVPGDAHETDVDGSHRRAGRRLQ